MTCSWWVRENVLKGFFDFLQALKRSLCCAGSGASFSKKDGSEGKKNARRICSYLQGTEGFGVSMSSAKGHLVVNYPKPRAIGGAVRLVWWYGGTVRLVWGGDTLVRWAQRQAVVLGY